MNQNNTDKLVTSFPKLYKKYKGFECEDGWFQILWNLSEHLNNKILEIEAMGAEYVPHATQVKEKYGTLRFYLSGCSTEARAIVDEMEQFIDAAENQTEITCELCGKPGKLIDKNNWLMVRCLEHTDITPSMWHKMQWDAGKV